MTMDVDGNGDGDDKLKPSEPSELEHAAPSLDDKREGLPHSEALEATSGTTAPSAGIDVDEQQLEVSAEALVSSDTVPITPLVQTDSVDLKSESASDLKLPPSTSAQSAQVDHPMPLTTKEPPTASTSVLPEGEVAPLTDAAETSVATADENGTLSNLEKEDGTFYWDVLDIDWSEVDLETQVRPVVIPAALSGVFPKGEDGDSHALIIICRFKLCTMCVSGTWSTLTRCAASSSGTLMLAGESNPSASTLRRTRTFTWTMDDYGFDELPRLAPKSLSSGLMSLFLLRLTTAGRRSVEEGFQRKRWTNRRSGIKRGKARRNTSPPGPDEELLPVLP
ncbi:hypothetical protein T439DRAFT_158295 [Meredithblackwellia eburnea MCA 4105]